MAISKVILNGVTQMDVTGKSVTADSMLPGVTALKNDGTDITGNLPTQAAQTIHPSMADQTIASGKYLTGAQTVKAVTITNLSAENIKSGVTVKVGDSTDDDCVASVTGTLAQTTYTATIVESYYNSSRFYVRPPYSTRSYYTTGDTFTFEAGWELTFGSMDSMGLYVDGELYGTGIYVDYIAPAHDINIVLGGTKNDVTFPTISITANGTYNVEDYCKAEVNVPSDDFVITLTKNASTGVWEPDCTYAEMYAAHSAGKNIAVKTNSEGFELSAFAIFTDPELGTDVCSYTVSEETADDTTGTYGVVFYTYSWTSNGVEDAGYYWQTYDTGNATAAPSDVASGKTYYDFEGRKTGTATQTVVTGTFSFDSAGDKSVTVPYTGSGYPISVSIYVTEGIKTDSTTWYQTVRRYAVGQYNFVKLNTQIAPTYNTVSSGQLNDGYAFVIYKSSESDATALSSNNYSTNSYVQLFTSSGPSSSYPNRVVTMPRANTLRMFVGYTQYSLMVGVSYTYVIAYSG